jgi:hypothetical protein
MKKNLLLIAFVIFGLITTQAQQAMMFTGVFELKVSDNVKIRTGGASKEQSSKEWKSGGKVGNQNIPSDVYQKLESNVAKAYKIELAEKTKGILKDAFLTDMSTNKRTKGIYNTQTREFLFGSAKNVSTGNNKDCGAVNVGLVKGKLSADMKKIEDGEIGAGFIAGCKPVIISADATFYFTGTSK